MLALPVALIILVLSVVHADRRHANQAAHAVCPETHVVEVDGRFEFGCGGREYVVTCDHGDCAVAPRSGPAPHEPERRPTR